MSLLYKALNSTSETLNGAPTLHSSLNPCVDLFFAVGSSRNEDITPLFAAAYGQNNELALRIALWARDIREGAGERQTFRNILKYLNEFHANSAFSKLILDKTPELGRWDDLLVVISEDISEETELGAYALHLITDALEYCDALCAKWMPRKGKLAARIRNYAGYSPKKYRKTLVTLSRTVEQQICANKWDEVKYSGVPSIAAKKYSRAFVKHDEERYLAYINDVKEGKAKVNAGAIFPHDVISGLRHGNKDLGEQQWKALPNYIANNMTNILPVVDVSGSMERSIGNSSTTCMDVSIALGLYLSERINGVFKDEFITFSEKPKMEHLHGSLVDRLNQLQRAEWGMNTNLEKVFELVLDKAIQNNIDASEMPSMIVILSDMEFDQCTGGRRHKTNFEAIKQMYSLTKYEMPTLVFWNLNARRGNVPCEFNEDGVLLVSGFSPAIMKDVLCGEVKTPVQIMLQAVMKDRYKFTQSLQNNNCK